MKVSNIFKHFWIICRHKFWVGYYCFKFGLYWQGIVHDLSKFSLTEFWESARYYDGSRSPIEICKEKNGVSKAWLHHKGRNKHHYEYWQDNFDSGTTHLRIPFKYVLEMCCDFLGAGKAYYRKDFTYLKEFYWWLDNIDKKKAMNEDAKMFVTIFFYRISDSQEVFKFNKKELESLYEDKNLLISEYNEILDYIELYNLRKRNKK